MSTKPRVFYKGVFCCQENSGDHYQLERELHELENEFSAIKRDVDWLRARRRSVQLARDVQRLRRNPNEANLTGHPALDSAANALRVRIGMEVFGVSDNQRSQQMDITLTPDDPDLAAIDRQIELAQAAIEASQLQIERLEADREKVLSRPQDIFEPGTYLIAERRNEGAVADPWVRMTLYRKDEKTGRWTSSGVGSGVHWSVVQRVLEDENFVVYNVETMREI